MNRDEILEMLGTLRQYVQHLGTLRALPRSQVVNDLTTQWAARYGLQSAVQCVLDIGLHILVATHHEKPHDSKETVIALGQAGIISEELAKRIEGMPGFRNIVVHRYFKTDPEIVASRLQNDLGDFTVFAQQIVSWVNRQP